MQLVIHGSVANAPYAALYLVQDYEAEAISTAAVSGTPLLQLQPSTPGHQWHVAAQGVAEDEVQLGAVESSLPDFDDVRQVALLDSLEDGRLGDLPHFVRANVLV